MTTREQFKLAFLKVCADEGQSTHETLERVEQATALMEKDAIWGAAALGGLGILKDTLIGIPRTAISAFGPTAAALGLTAAVGLPLAAGAAAGVGLQRATSSDSSVDEAKADELIEEYQAQAEQAKRHAAMREFHQKVLPHAGHRY